MIKLKIDNWFQKSEDYTRVIGQMSNGCDIYMCHNFENDIVEPYDMEKWKDGKEYEFNTLKELNDFVESCEIDFRDDVKACFSDWTWKVLNKKLYIDGSEDNGMIFTITCHDEWMN